MAAQAGGRGPHRAQGREQPKAAGLAGGTRRESQWGRTCRPGRKTSAKAVVGTWGRDLLVTWPPDPPVPSASLPSGSSVSRGPPRLSVLPAPSAPRRSPPWGPPSRRGRISLFTLSASQLPFLGQEGTRWGWGRAGRKEREEAHVGERQSPGQPSRGLHWSWAGGQRAEQGPAPGSRGLTWRGAGARAPARGTGP